MEVNEQERKMLQEALAKDRYYQRNLTLRVGDVFKVKQLYFRVSDITDKGIVADGISRREFYERRGR